MYVCMYACMHVCMYFFIHTHIHTYIWGSLSGDGGSGYGRAAPHKNNKKANAERTRRTKQTYSHHGVSLAPDSARASPEWLVMVLRGPQARPAWRIKHVFFLFDVLSFSREKPRARKTQNTKTLHFQTVWKCRENVMKMYWTCNENVGKNPKV